MESIVCEDDVQIMGECASHPRHDFHSYKVHELHGNDIDNRVRFCQLLHETTRQSELFSLVLILLMKLRSQRLQERYPMMLIPPCI